MSALDEFVVEVRPGELMYTGRCSIAELTAAGLLLLLADDVPDTIWAGRWQVVAAALEARVNALPKAQRPPEWRLVLDGMAQLPYELREQIAPRLRDGMTAAKREREARRCR